MCLTTVFFSPHFSSASRPLLRNRRTIKRRIAPGVTPPPPTGLMCELLTMPEKAAIEDPHPRFGWIVNSWEKDTLQSAYRILVSSEESRLEEDLGDMWDTGRVESNQSIGVVYSGKILKPGSAYFWKVCTWDNCGKASPFSETQQFRTGEFSSPYSTTRYPLEKHRIPPVRVVRKGLGHVFVDFGKAAFATLELVLTSPVDGHEMEVHLGEKTSGPNTVDREPGGSVRYRRMTLSLEKGTHAYTVEIPPDDRNTRETAIKMPREVGEVLPFRFCELVGCPCEIDASQIRQVAVTYPFCDAASDFRSSDPILNDVWDLCKYSMKATSFCGVYVDGDRERIPYEGDAYLNQLGHYCVDREFTLARYTHEYLIHNPTWPTEWILHSVLIGWADYLHTGDISSLENHYEDLQAKSLSALAREDGLISTRTGLVTPEVLKAIHFNGKLRDLVDWPHGDVLGLTGGFGETDGFEFEDINTVVNAFHYRALVLMSRIAEVLGMAEDARTYSVNAQRVEEAFNEILLDKETGVYVDGEGNAHSSLHANMLPLAFGMVPDQYRETVADFIKSRGMACSVYGTQYLLESLYAAGEADYALSLLTSTTERSWAHMMDDIGSTITLEAWDPKYKPNLDWNHAWGAAPANIIPRCLMGVQPLEPGFGKIQVKPQPGGLEWASLDLPTIRGTVHIDFRNDKGSFKLNVNIPANTTAEVYIPRISGKSNAVRVDGIKHEAEIEGEFFRIGNVGSGGHVFESEE